MSPQNLTFQSLSRGRELSGEERSVGRLFARGGTRRSRKGKACVVVHIRYIYIYINSISRAKASEASFIFGEPELYFGTEIADDSYTVEMRLPTGACFARVELSTPVPIRSLPSIRPNFPSILLFPFRKFYTRVYTFSHEYHICFFFLFDEYRSREGRDFENIVSPDRSVRKMTGRKWLVYTIA